MVSSAVFSSGSVRRACVALGARENGRAGTGERVEKGKEGPCSTARSAIKKGGGARAPFLWIGTCFNSLLYIFHISDTTQKRLIAKWRKPRPVVVVAAGAMAAVAGGARLLGPGEGGGDCSLAGTGQKTFGEGLVQGALVPCFFAFFIGRIHERLSLAVKAEAPRSQAVVCSRRGAGACWAGFPYLGSGGPP